MLKNLVFLFLTAAPCFVNAQTLPEDYFEAHIRPLLIERCGECHGDEAPEGDLRLTSRKALLQRGESGPALNLDHPEQGVLWRALHWEGEVQMPPQGKLSDAELNRLRTWLQSGAPWPESGAIRSQGKKEMTVSDADREHWAFRPIQLPPNPKLTNDSRARTEVDRFVLARLEEAGLELSAEADRRTLIRRATYDLHGLPPSFEEVERFVADPDPLAYEKLVDQLLVSPRYGERWGRHWLDVARYADTKDGVLMYGDARLRPYAYTYRDYVIRAFNEDLPFHEFIRDQVAVDLRPEPVPTWRWAALGLLTLGRQFDNNPHDVIDDQIDTLTRGFMGLTVSCARCHDHKYDPVPIADYYSLYGILASCEVPAELPVIDNGISEPGEESAECALTLKRHELNQFVASQHRFLSQVARDRTPDYLAKIAAQPEDPLEKAVFFLSLAPEDLRPSIVIRWRRYLADHAQPTDPVFGIWRDLLAIPEPSAPEGTVAYEDAIREVLERWKNVPAGVEPGQCNPRLLNHLLASALTNRRAIAEAFGAVLLACSQLDSQSQSQLGPEDRAAWNQLAEVLHSTRSPCHIPLSQTFRYMSRAEIDRYGGLLTELDVLAATLPGTKARAMVVVDKPEPYEPRIFVRGNAAQPGRPVPRQFVSIATHQPPQPFTKGSGRWDLAEALVSPHNPLTARVIVNRVWMHHFGEPLVATPNDFGRRSQPPTHPELLDYLAADFVRNGWSLKILHRQLMISSVYRQASTADGASQRCAKEKDPDNRLLWRMNRRRLEFEAMRDTLLMAAGNLTFRQGGRPVDVLGDPGQTCRTVFGLVDRQSLPAAFRAFDFANPDTSTERRPRTMMPQQALFALNSDLVVNQARMLVQFSNLEAEANLGARVEQLFRKVLGRNPTPDEIKEALQFVETTPGTTSGMTSWEQLAQVLLVSNELMYVD